MKTFTAVVLACMTAVSALAADTPEMVFSRAQKLEQEGKISHAAEEYRVFLRNHRGHSKELEVYYRLATCLDSLGMIDEAVLLLQTATKTPADRFRNRADALFLQGKLQGALDQHAAAAETLELLLAEGAGLYEEEALSLCGSYYAVAKKYNEAAAKFNILKNRKDSKLAERAGFKLAMVWLEAGKLDLAVEAVSDFATRWPANKEARGLMIRIANLFRQQRKYDQCISICEQLKTKFPLSVQGRAADYIMGLCYYHKKQFAKAEETLAAVARVPENVESGLAAEALMKAAAILFNELADAPRAMLSYEAAAELAKAHSTEERKAEMLELCYFRLAEHNFNDKKWQVALKFYGLLKDVGTEVDILPRVMRCQAELGMGVDTSRRSDGEIALIKKKIAEYPGTFAAAEGEVFLADHELGRLRGGGRAAAPFVKISKTYADIGRRYPANILAEQHLASFIQFQVGRCLTSAYLAERRTVANSEIWKEAVAAFEKVMTVDKATPYQIQAIENIAGVADAAGQKQKSFEAYKRLYEIAGEQFHKDEANGGARDKMTGYLRSMLSRADSDGGTEKAIALCKSIIEREGVQSDAARYTLFYMADLHFMRKNFPSAAATYSEFVKTYGPKQGADGNLDGGPWQVEAKDWKIEQVYEAAVRVAHSWYQLGHNQKMVKAYDWLSVNFPHHNKWVAEAQYWLTMELADGATAKEPETKRKIANMFWDKIVSPKPLSDEAHTAALLPNQQIGRKQSAADYHFWVRDPDMQKYVEPAIIKCGEIMSELKEHDAAARAFVTYLKLYTPTWGAENWTPPKGGYGSIALYALGREYVAMRQFQEMIDVYQPYLNGMRDDKLRISALRFMGFHLSTDEMKEAGAKAYATILDEYGTNYKDEKGNEIPVPQGARIRQDESGWNGMRMPMPAKVDLGQVRYALGHLYWKNEDWPSCVRALLPFADDPELRKNKSRAKALYMVGQCYYKARDYKNGFTVLWKLISTEPKFEAIEEAYTRAAVGCTELGLHSEMKEIHKRFVLRHPTSINRPHMDLHLAVAILRDGDLDGGISRLKSIAGSDTYEDVKADAWYYLGINEVTPGKGKRTGPLTPAHHREALRYLLKSVACLPRGRSCLAAAKSYMALEKWELARALLDRTVREFPDSRKQTIDEAKELLPVTLREIAKDVK